MSAPDFHGSWLQQLSENSFQMLLMLVEDSPLGSWCWWPELRMTVKEAEAPLGRAAVMPCRAQESDFWTLSRVNPSILERKVWETFYLENGKEICYTPIFSHCQTWGTLTGTRGTFPCPTSYPTRERIAASRDVICFDNIRVSEKKFFFFSKCHTS